MNLSSLNLRKKAMQPSEWYEYRPRGRNWVVLHMKRDATGGTGEKVGSFLSREEARRECYRLNGWKYKEPDKQKEDGKGKV